VRVMASDAELGRSALITEILGVRYQNPRGSSC
jgi:hypothetical protein